MKPVMQTRLSNPEGTIQGNCFTACVASLLEKAVEEVPDMQGEDGAWFDPFWNTLIAHGMRFEGTRYRFRTGPDGQRIEVSDFWEDMAAYPGVDGYVIAGGASPREYVTRGHACVFYGCALAHDPHPSGDGLKEVQYFYLITRSRA